MQCYWECIYIACPSSINFRHIHRYSRTSLSRTRLFRITAYLEVKIWSLFLHETMTTGNKIMWKRGEIAPKEQFLLFSKLFYIYIFLTSGVKLHTDLLNVVVLLFSSLSQIWYVEVRISRSVSVSPLEFEITRVDCSYMDHWNFFQQSKKLGVRMIKVSTVSKIYHPKLPTNIYNQRIVRLNSAPPPPTPNTLDPLLPFHNALKWMMGNKRAEL